MTTLCRLYRVRSQTYNMLRSHVQLGCDLDDMGSIFHVDETVSFPVGDDVSERMEEMRHSGETDDDLLLRILSGEPN